MPPNVYVPSAAVVVVPSTVPALQLVPSRSVIVTPATRPSVGVGSIVSLRLRSM